MSELAISSTNWLAISLRNSAAIIFNLNDTQQWQYLEPIVNIDQPKATTPTATAVSKKQAEDDDDNSADLCRNLVKFTPNGQKLAINGQNKQIYIYIPSDYEVKKTYWQLQRIITVKKRASALDLTNDVLLIADKSGDVYKTDLSTDTNLILTSDDCIMGHLSMLLDIAFVRTKENEEFILTADRDEKIRLSHYPNAYNIQGYCLGHTEFVSNVKLIDQNHILSASGDGKLKPSFEKNDLYLFFFSGTLRLWHLPDCVELNLFETKTLISSSKEIFYTSSLNSEDTQSSLDSSSMNYSIWKMDIASSSSDTFIALSIYAYRNHSIYLTTLSNIEKSIKLTFDTKYGTIIDYCFLSKDSPCDLYILFDSNIFLQVNILKIFSCDKNEFYEENDQTINRILSTKEFNLMNNLNSIEVIFKQLFKSRGEPGDCSYYKRKNERIEQQEEKRRKKQQSKENV